MQAVPCLALPGRARQLSPVRALRGRGRAAGAPRDAVFQGDYRKYDRPDAGKTRARALHPGHRLTGRSIVARSAHNPLDGWQVDRESICTIGRALQRPECILAERDGTLWAADARGDVMR